MAFTEFEMVLILRWVWSGVHLILELTMRDCASTSRSHTLKEPSDIPFCAPNKMKHTVSLDGSTIYNILEARVHTCSVSGGTATTYGFTNQ